MLLTPPALGQAAPEPDVSQVAGFSFQMDGWDIHPLLSGDPADPLTQLVEGLLLLRTHPAPAANNISAVWARRDFVQTTGGGWEPVWEADAWSGESVASVVKWMVDHTSLPTPESVVTDWPIDHLAGLYATAIIAPDPVPLGAGLPLFHPLEPIAATIDDPSALLSALEDLGEPASASVVTSPGSAGASGGVQPGDGELTPQDCGVARTTEALWSLIADSTEAELLTPGDAVIMMRDFFGLGPLNCCIPLARFVTPPVAGPWTCTPWVQTGDSNQTGNCSATSIWITTCSRTLTRTCTWVSVCRTTTTTQTSTETKKDCSSSECESAGPGCPTPAAGAAICLGVPGNLDAPPPAAPPPAGIVDGCNRPTTRTNWTPICLP